MTHFHRRALLATPILAAAPAFAQTYPARPVRVIVPSPPGNMSDLIARAPLAPSAYRP